MTIKINKEEILKGENNRNCGGEADPRILKELGDWFKVKAIKKAAIRGGGYYAPIQTTKSGANKVWGFDGLDEPQATLSLHRAIIAAAKDAGVPLKDIIAAAQAAGVPLKDIIAAAKDAELKKDDNEFWEVFEKNKEIIGCVCSGKGNIILHGPPGTSKTYCAKKISDLLVALENGATCLDKNFRIVQFHPSMTYEDFIRGLRAKPVGATISYEAENAIFGEMCVEAAKDPNNYYVLIVDEINRANLPSVFGELIYALEYRGEAVNTPYEVNSSKELIVPPNLVLIGTMNTADRSVGQMDYAIRRRFQFFPLLPDVQKVRDEVAKETFQNVLRLFVKDPTASPIDWSDRADTLSHDFQASDVAIGHTYFLGQDWKNSFKFQVLPMLVEYLKDGVLLDDAQQIKRKKIKEIHFKKLDEEPEKVVEAFNALFK